MLPLTNVSIHDVANRARVAGVAATSEKYFENVQPPTDIKIFTFGCAAFSLRSSSKFPYSVWSG